MKKRYVTPIAEVVKFQYRDQVVAVSGGGGIASCHFNTLNDENWKCFAGWINDGRMGQ